MYRYLQTYLIAFFIAAVMVPTAGLFAHGGGGGGHGGGGHGGDWGHGGGMVIGIAATVTGIADIITIMGVATATAMGSMALD